MEKRIGETDYYHIAILPFLKSLIQSSKDLRKNSNPLHFFSFCSSGYSIEALLPQAEILFSNNPYLSRLARLLCNLRSLLCQQKNNGGYSPNSVLYRYFVSYKICKASLAIEAEIQGYFDRELVGNLVDKLGEAGLDYGVEDKVSILKDFEYRLSGGFDGNLQEIVLKGKLFNLLESLVSEPGCSRKLRERAARSVLAMVKFNKDVFVGLVLMGPIIHELILMSTCSSVRVLYSLIQLIRTPLIDEMESRGDIPLIVNILDARSVDLRARGVDCICEIAFSGREEVVKKLLELRVVEKLVEMQRETSTAMESDGLDSRSNAQAGNNDEEKEEEDITGEDSPFWGCVQRFAVQVEVGEGLSREEKKFLKAEILMRIRKVSLSEMEAASLIAEVLWGSSP